MESVTKNVETSALLTRANERVPLTDVSVQGEIMSGHACVRVRQTYKNTLQKPIEAIYTFPLSAEAVLSGFRMTCNGRTCEGVVKEREEAFHAYDDALVQGHGAALVEEERANVFTASVGNILPNEEVVIEIETIERLFAEEGAVRFVLPTLVAPRYITGSASGARTAHGTSEPTREVPDADRISPPRAGNLAYKISLSLSVDMGEHAVLESPSHSITTSRVSKIARAEFSGEPLDRDFVLLISNGESAAQANVSASIACHRESGKQGYFALTVVPDLFEEKASQGPLTCVFVLDRSGSMGGASIVEARRALRLCLRQLREGDLFNVLAFDNLTEPFAESPVPFTSKTLKEADAWIDAIDARGGTELLTPMETAVQMAAGGIVVLLTDGQVGNEDQIFARVKSRAGKTRIYSFGIGTNVSTVLLTNLAVATNGAVEQIHPGERIDDKVVAQFARATATRITEVTVSFENVDASELAPSTPNDLVDGEPWTLFGVFEKAAIGRALIRGKKSGDPFVLDVPVYLPETESAPFVERLWAKERIRIFERALVTSNADARRADATKKRIVDLCVAHRIASRFASFVVIEKREGDRRTSTPAETKIVPVHLPAGWAAQRASPDLMGGFAGAVSRGAPLPAHSVSAPMRSMGAIRPAMGSPFGGGGGAPPGAAPPRASAPARPAMMAPPQAPRAASPSSSADMMKKGGADGASTLGRSREPIGEGRDARTADLLSQQGASGLFGGDLGIDESCRKTAQILISLDEENIDASHSVYGAQIRKAVAAMLKEIDKLTDESTRRLVIVVSWLVSGRRTRIDVARDAARFGAASFVASVEAAREFLENRAP